jgi:hypothetical protein
VNSGCERARNDERDKRPRLEFKKQQLDSKNHPCDRGVEGSRHAGSRAAGEQYFALDRGSVEGLANERADGSPSLNDRAFGAERAAGADRDGRRDGLQDSDPRGDAAAVEQDCLHRFGNAVPLDFRSPVLGHDANDKAADDRSHDDHPTEVVVLWAGEVGRPAMEEEEIGEESNQLIESECNNAGHQADGGGER